MKMLWAINLAGLAAVVLLAAWVMGHPADEPETRPPRGVMLSGWNVQTYDADTIVVKLDAPTVRVRMLDCWAPEVRGAQRELGIAARDKALGVIPGRGERVYVWVPFDRNGLRHAGDVFSMSRLLAAVYLDDDSDETVAAKLRSSGAAYATRDELREHLAAEGLRGVPIADPPAEDAAEVPKVPGWGELYRQTQGGGP